MSEFFPLINNSTSADSYQSFQSSSTGTAVGAQVLLGVSSSKAEFVKLPGLFLDCERRFVLHQLQPHGHRRIPTHSEQRVWLALQQLKQ
jgi:hypothetical protein